jgi:hypothetical protein
MIFMPRIGGRKEICIDVGVSLLVIVAFEVSLLGSGRFVVIGPLTLRMWLFLVAGLYAVIRLVAHGRIKLSTFAILMSLTMLLCFGALIGLLQNARLDLIADDIKPLLFWFTLCFVEMTMRTERLLKLVVRIIKSAAIIMTVGYVAILSLLYMGVISIHAWLEWQRSDAAAGQFFVRGFSGLFLYTGSLYMAIGLIFFAFDRNWRAKLVSFWVILALLATGARGYALGFMGVLLVHSVTATEGLGRRLRYFIAPSAVAIMLLVLLFSSSLMGREVSDASRIANINEVVNRVTPLSIEFGHGLGVSVPDKEVHMETSYLEIFHKQGLLGLAWWASIFLLLIMRYRRARRINYLYAQPLFLSALFVALGSVANPYLTGPPGIFVWIIALVGLDVVSKNHLSERSLENTNV